MIRLEKLSKSFGRTKALDGLTLTAEAGEKIALVGANGAGRRRFRRNKASSVKSSVKYVDLHRTGSPSRMRRSPLRLRKNLTSARGPCSMQFGTHLRHEFLRRNNILGAADGGGPVQCNFTSRTAYTNAHPDMRGQTRRPGSGCKGHPWPCSHELEHCERHGGNSRDLVLRAPGRRHHGGVWFDDGGEAAFLVQILHVVGTALALASWLYENRSNPAEE